MNTIKDFLNQKLGLKQFVVIALAVLIPLFIVMAIFDKIVMPLFVHSIDVIKVPNVTGMTMNKAESIIKNSGLRIAEVRDAYSEKVPKGLIISQLPFGNSEVRKGRRMYIIVSKGIEKIIVPNLIGRTEREARIQLMSMGFQVGSVIEEENEEGIRGQVISQSISPGLKIPFGNTISFVICKGKVVEVPNLIGKTYEEAKFILEELGLFLADPLYSSAENGTFQSGVIFRQDFLAGEKVEEGDVITVTVSE